MCHVTSAFVSSYSLLAVRRRVTAVLQKYFMSGSEYKVLEDDLGASMLEVEWTNQHGCGGNEDTDPHKLNCNLVFQMMCHEDSADVTGTAVSTSEQVLHYTYTYDLYIYTLCVYY